MVASGEQGRLCNRTVAPPETGARTLSIPRQPGLAPTPIQVRQVPWPAITAGLAREDCGRWFAKRPPAGNREAAGFRETICQAPAIWVDCVDEVADRPID